MGNRQTGNKLFKTIAGLCNCAGRFLSYLADPILAIGILSHYEAQIIHVENIPFFSWT